MQLPPQAAASSPASAQTWWHRNVAFRWYTLSWNLYKCRVHVFKNLASHVGSVVRWSLVAISGALGITLAFLGVTPTAEQLAGYLIPAAAMIGGTTAIIFSISILPMQGTGDISFSRYLEEYTGDWRYQQRIYFAIILIALGLFAAALYLLNSGNATPLLTIRVVLATSLTFVGTVFALIDKQYDLVRRKMSPINTIDFLRTRALLRVKGLRKDAKRVAKLLQFKAPVHDDVALATAYSILSSPAFAELHGLVETLAELSLKLSGRHEVENAVSALRAIGDVVVAYLADRKSSSQISWSAHVPLATESDSHSLLTSTLERVNDVSLQASRTGNEAVTIGLITEVYPRLISAGAEISYLPANGAENPILDLMTVSLSLHIRDCASSGEADALLRGTRVLGDAAILAIGNGLQLSISVLFEQLMRCLQVGLSIGALATVDACIDAYHNALIALFEGGDAERKSHIRLILQGIGGATTGIAGALRGNRFAEPIVAGWSLSRGYGGINAILQRFVTRYDLVDSEERRQQYRSDLVVFLEELRSSIRDSSKMVSDAEGMFANALASVINAVCGFAQTALTSDSFDDVRERVLRCWTTFAYLPYFIISDAPLVTGHSFNLETMLDSVTLAGVAATDLNEPWVVIASIKGIFAAASKLLEKTGDDTSGRNEPRLLLGAAYLGICAYRRGWTAVAETYRDEMRAFEPKYRERYLSHLPLGLGVEFDVNTHNVPALPHPDEPLRELVRWRQNFDYERLNGAHFGSNAEIYRRATEADVDAFIAFVWPGIIGAASE